MGEIKISDFKAAHFIGVGGVSMSFLAETLANRGMAVTGSDREQSVLTNRLSEKGIPISIGHRAENITNQDLVVYNSAIHRDNPERIRAEELGIRIIHRAALLGTLLEDYPFPICIAGTHGKTTATSMVAEIFLQANKNPTISVGGMLPSIGGNSWRGGDEYFIVESDEYTDTFLKFFPYIGIILNVELDHLDYFKDIHQVWRSFHQFASQISGSLVMNREIEGFETIVDGLSCDVVTFGIQDKTADWVAQEIVYEEGIPSFDVYCKNSFVTHMTLGVRGEHNVYNALAACAAAYALGITAEEIREGLARYKGTNRRFEQKGTIRGITILDDYAHHPTEILSTLSTARKLSYDRIVVVFQPHTYSRTKELLDSFAHALLLADRVIVLDIYAAREVETGEIHARDLVEKLRQLGHAHAVYAESFAWAEEYVFASGVPGDLLITMGAGNVYLLGDTMLNTKLSTVSTSK